MANSFYYKIVGDTMFYSDANDDGSFTETTINNSGNIASCKYARPYKEGMAIPYDSPNLYQPFNFNTFEEIDFSGFDCITTNYLGTIFAGNENLKRIIFGNHPPKSKGDYTQSIFTGCGGVNAKELTVEGNITLNDGDLGQWFKFSNYESIKFKNFIVSYNGEWGFSDGVFWNMNNIKSVDYSGIETTGQFNNLYCQNLPLEFLFLPSYSKTRSTYRGVFNGLSNGIDTLTIKGDLTGLKSLAGMFSNIKSNVLDISALKYDNDINNLDSAFQNMSCTTIYATKNIYNGQGIEGYRPFEGSGNLIGGSGSAYSTYGNGGQYAKIDGGADSPGYFTMGTPEYNLVIDVIPAGAATITYRQDRDEFTFDVKYTPDYTFNYFYYKDPLGNYGEKVKTLQKAIIPLTEPGTYTAYFRFEKALNPFDPDNPGGGTTPIKDLPSDTLEDKTASTGLNNLLDRYETTTYGRGIYKIFIPTEAQFEAFMQAIYSEELQTKIDNSTFRDIDGIQDLILGYNVLPVSLPADGTKALGFGFLEWLMKYASTTLQFDYTNKKEIEVDMGELTIERVWNNFLDFSPYTTIKIYLPFIGEQTLDNDDVMGKVLHLKYNIELLTGNCTAFILVNNSVHYQFTGNCLYQIPLASNSFAEIKNNYIQNIASSISKIAIGDFKADDQAAAGAGLAVNTAALMTNKPRAGDKANCLSGNSAYNNLPYPYITYTRRLPAVPTSYGHNNGYVCLKTLKLEDLKGYTEVASIHLDGLPFTDTELQELDNILKEGFIL